jgi:hypothetical protein
MSGYAQDSDIITTRAALAEYTAPEDGLGRFHKPIGFAEYVDEVEHQLTRTGMVVRSEEHLVGHEGQRHFGILELAPAIEGELIQAKDWSMFLGLRGSHDQSVQRGLALGRSVMVCSNLCFSGDIATISTKQTLNIWTRLPGMIYEAVSRIPELAHMEEDRVNRMKEFEIRPRQGDMLLVEALRRGYVSSAQLSRAVTEWDRPSHDEFSENGFTAWRLEQAVTEAVKPANTSNHNLFTVQNRTRGFSSLMIELMEAA